MKKLLCTMLMTTALSFQVLSTNITCFVVMVYKGNCERGKALTFSSTDKLTKIRETVKTMYHDKYGLYPQEMSWSEVNKDKLIAQKKFEHHDIATPEMLDITLGDLDIEKMMCILAKD